MTSARPLQTHLVDDYQRDGAVVLRAVLTPSEVRRLTEGIEHNLANPSALCTVASQPDDPGRFVEDFCTWQHNAAYREILCRSALPHVAAQNLPFHEAMLSWPSGKRETDGVWAKHWYANVEKTTTFQPYVPKDEPIPPRLESLLERSQADYNLLYAQRLGQG